MQATMISLGAFLCSVLQRSRRAKSLMTGLCLMADWAAMYKMLRTAVRAIAHEVTN